MSAGAPVSSQGSTGEGPAFRVHGIVSRTQVLDPLDRGLQVPAGCQLEAALVSCKGRLLLRQNRKGEGLPGRCYHAAQWNGNHRSSPLLFSTRSKSLDLLTPKGGGFTGA